MFVGLHSGVLRLQDTREKGGCRRGFGDGAEARVKDKMVWPCGGVSLRIGLDGFGRFECFGCNLVALQVTNGVQGREARAGLGRLFLCD
jgi:hypothetical protein